LKLFFGYQDHSDYCDCVEDEETFKKTLTNEEKKLLDIPSMKLANIACRKRMLSMPARRKKFKQEHPATPQEAFLTTGRSPFNRENIMDWVLRDPIETKMAGIFIEDYYMEGTAKIAKSLWTDRGGKVGEPVPLTKLNIPTAGTMDGNTVIEEMLTVDLSYLVAGTFLSLSVLRNCRTRGRISTVKPSDSSNSPARRTRSSLHCSRHRMVGPPRAPSLWYSQSLALFRNSRIPEVRYLSGVGSRTPRFSPLERSSVGSPVSSLGPFLCIAPPAD
jgi:hypothetical protein